MTILIYMAAVAELVRRGHARVKALGTLNCDGADVMVGFMVCSLLTTIVKDMVNVLVNVFALPFMVCSTCGVVCCVNSVALVPSCADVVFKIITTIIYAIIISIMIYTGSLRRGPTTIVQPGTPGTNGEVLLRHVGPL